LQETGNNEANFQQTQNPQVLEHKLKGLAKVTFHSQLSPLRYLTGQAAVDTQVKQIQKHQVFRELVLE
jgi:hypothetical protein